MLLCLRCGGMGYIAEYSHVQKGICFKCKGTGRKFNSINNSNSSYGSRIFGRKGIYIEKNIGGTKVVLSTQSDPGGRFIGYSVYIKGSGLPGISCKRYKDAKGALEKFVREIKNGKVSEKQQEQMINNLSC